MPTPAARTLGHDLTVGNVSKQLFTFALPLFLASLLQTAYNLVDMVVVGHFVGSDGLAAVSIGSDVSNVLMFVAMGFSGAGQVLIAQLVGSGRRDKIADMIGTLFTFLLGCALVLTVVCVVFHRQLISLIKTPPEALTYTTQFIVTTSVGLIFIYGYNIVSAVLRGMGDSRRPFQFIAIAVSINVVLDLVFVGLLGWAVFGAALATVIAQASSFLFAIVFLYRRREQFGFDFALSSFRIRKGALLPLLGLGIPMVLQSMAISSSKLFITSWINSYGVIATAVSGVGNKIQMVAGVFGQALSTAGSAMIAQNVGARKHERIPRIIGTSLAFNAVIAATLTVITLAFPSVIFGFFTTDESVLNMAMTYIPVLILTYGSGILRPPMLALINGTGNYKLNLTIAILDGIVVRVGLSLLLGLTFHKGLLGFWYGAAIASYMPFVIGGIYYLSGRWRTRGVV